MQLLQSKQALMFYLGVPVVWALLAAIYSIGLISSLPFGFRLLYWLTFALPFWLFADLCSRLSVVLLKPWAPPPALVLGLGGALAVFVSRPYFQWRHRFQSDILEGVARVDQPMPLVPESLAQLGKIFEIYGPGALLWTLTGLLFWYQFERPRYLAHAPAELKLPSAIHAIAEPAPRKRILGPDDPVGLLAALPPHLGREVITVEAQDHHVSVHTALGHAQVLYKFRDAVRDLAGFDGLQVHRSFWVARQAIERIAPHGSGHLLHLKTGQRVPVSRAYKAVIRQFGLIEA
jgi:hypothetical protein